MYKGAGMARFRWRNGSKKAANRNRAVSRKTVAVDYHLSLVLAFSVEKLRLNTRSRNAVKAASIVTLRQLATTSTNEVLGWEKCGMGTVDNIMYALSDFGLSLDTDFISPSRSIPNMGEQFPWDEWAI